MTDKILVQAPWERRSARLDRLYVKTPALNEALGLLEAFCENGYRGPERTACCFVVVGSTNAGKSRLFLSYCERPECQPDGDLMPVVRFTAPSPFNLPDFLAEFLTALRTKSFVETQRIVR